MSLIEKIDEKIKWCEEMNKKAITIEFKNIEKGLEMARGIILSEQKEPIGNSEQLTEQKEPCDFCKNIYTLKLHLIHTQNLSHHYLDLAKSYCPKCGRPLNNLPTIMSSPDSAFTSAVDD